MGVIREWAHLRGPDFAALDREKTVVLVTCSPLEVHGPHLPVEADLRESEGLLERSAELLHERAPEIAFVRLPPVWMAADVLPHSGSVRFRPSTVRLVLREMGESLARQGFRHVWVGNFHGGPRHILAIEAASDDVHKRTGMGMISVFSALVRKLTGGSSDLAGRLDGVGGLRASELKGDSHGGLVETAMLLHLVGDLVDPAYTSLPPRSIELVLKERGEAPLQKGEKPTTLELLRALPFKQRYYEDETYAGAPAGATREQGRAILDALAGDAAEILEARYRGTLSIDDCHSPLWPMRHWMMSERVGRLFDRLVQTRPPGV